MTLFREKLFEWLKINRKFIGQLLLSIVVLSLLLAVIKSQMVNNLAWLEGRWANGHETYTLLPQNHGRTTWKIKRSNMTKFDTVTVTADSNKKTLILSDHTEKTTYTLTRITKKKLTLSLQRGKKTRNVGVLEKRED